MSYKGKTYKVIVGNPVTAYTEDIFDFLIEFSKVNSGQTIVLDIYKGKNQDALDFVRIFKEL